jgi:hypothetical protein
MKKCIYGLAGWILLFGSGEAMAEMVPISARSSAMGQAMLAEQGSMAVWVNPAGLGEIQAWEVATVIEKPLAGLPGIASMWQGGLSGGGPVDIGQGKIGRVAFSYFWFQAENMLREQAVAGAYEMKIIPALSFGLGVKYLRRDYLIGNDPLAAIDPIFQEQQGRGVISVDTGVVADLTSLTGPKHPLHMGLAGRNLNQPDWGLRTEDRLPLEIQCGGQWEPVEWGFNLVADLLIPLTPSETSPEPVSFQAGIEKDFGGIAARLGCNSYQATGGFGVGFGDWQLDYALAVQFNLMSDNYQTHRISLSWSPAVSKPVMSKTTGSKK